MNGRIFLLGEDGELSRLDEERYESEDLLQSLLAKYPDLIPGDQIDSDEPRQWLLIDREAGIPKEEGGSDNWSLDHLLIDQDGIPTLVEVKRSTDTRIRREIVGQMLDYAANAVVYWPLETIQAKFEARCEREGCDPDEELNAFLEPNGDPAEFWTAIKTNLQAGRVRLVFVADEIPSELQRVIEFLNSQMDPAEVLAVEVKQFTGSTMKSLVPRVLGFTAQAQRRKGQGNGEGRQWDEQSFFDELAKRCGPIAVSAARKVLTWCRANCTEVWWGRGKRSGSFTPVVVRNGTYIQPFSVWTYGYFSFHFEYLAKKRPYDDVRRRQEIVDELKRIPSIELPHDAVDRRPSISVAILDEKETFDRVMSVMASVVTEFKQL